MRIHIKLLLAVSVPFLLAFLLCGIIFTGYFSDIFRRQLIVDETEKLGKALQQIVYVQSETEQFARSIAVDAEIQDLITPRQEEDFLDELLRRKRISAALTRFINQKEHFGSVYIITHGQIVSSQAYDRENTIGLELDWGWYESFKRSSRTAGFTVRHQGYVDSARVNFISYVLQFRDIQTGNRVLGNIVINVEATLFDDIAGTRSDMLDGQLLLDGEGNILFRQGNLPVDTAFLAEEGTPDPMRIAQTDPGYGWTLISRLSEEAIGHKLRFIPTFFTAVFVAFLAAILLLLYPLLTNITAPVRRLTRLAAKVSEGDLDQRIHIHTRDEMQELGESFNHMLGELQLYIQKALEQEKRQKDMEIQLLMLQINPHFIFNTLNNIIYLAQLEKHEEVITFTRAFINLLQDSLVASGDSGLIPLQQEMDNAESYVLLSRYKYPDKYTAQFRLEPSLAEFPVPRILLQPLIENAIIHGLHPKKGPGHIDVTADREDGAVVLRVRDDGLGADPERLDQTLRSPAERVGKMRSIGIANTRERMRILYGEQFHMRVDTSTEGTTVSMHIPAEGPLRGTSGQQQAIG